MPLANKEAPRRGQLPRVNTSLYKQISADIRSRIDRGDWSYDIPLPTESELMGLYVASRGTIRRAYDELVANGSVVRKPGQGTFVARFGSAATGKPVIPFSQGASFTRFIPGAATKKLHTAIVPASKVGASIRSAFRVRGDARVAVICRLRSDPDGPISIHTAYLLAKEFPNILDEDLTSLAQVYEKFGRILTRGTERLHVREATGNEAELLEIRPSESRTVVERERFSFDQRESLLEVLYAIDRVGRLAYKYDFVNDLTFERFFAKSKHARKTTPESRDV